MRKHISKRGVALAAAILRAPAHQRSRKREYKASCDGGSQNIAIEKSLPHDEWDQAIGELSLACDSFDRAPHVKYCENEEWHDHDPDIYPSDEPENHSDIDDRDQERDAEIKEYEIRQDKPPELRTLERK